ncbi:MAG: pantoate--beta-alanine ligase [Stagnimonas sp.]|nr:pantoate--beta-alanine ligase [Stagnimonas sp.]
MRTVHTVAELRAQLAAWRTAGERIAFVPTMGNLHAGHIELVRQGRQRAQRVVASVFVNPLQFGVNEDFGRYPRSLPQDAAQLITAGCDLLFAPGVEEVYPQGVGATTVRVAGVTEMLEGEFRPGHFDGVATVVNILFNLVQPDVALFGQKDYQQLAVIRRMVADLRLPLEVVGVPTLRAEDGLALSSRNQYLSAEERARATTVHRVLSRIAEGLRAGRRDYEVLQSEAALTLQRAGFRPQYVAIRSAELLEPAASATDWVVLVAAFLGTTRLIDNLVVAAG